ncbi:exported hypothetical protein [Tenacibaculum maritimum]|uniref:hypothetical protein n=1 Tax=Tenacibaculum maritimum TaxID=107401 RepID=UPI0012E451E6|nr:hypothetical protein [Tenacibaculum maritimum]CAA0143791.1 exported hypothetical protein [Tenacibaculum maritimum]CAA0144419.1 exported hypothetical protein [Tenacibaculum maritimum]CAA0205438.1 exported hypothetical protein [Tenacibaculum maritimum]CAA0248516.1 exported hypothetical protein [Tenacibaculum maritimum]
MKNKITILLFFFSLSYNLLSQSTINTVYTINKGSKGGYERLEFEISKYRISKKDSYYDKTETNTVELKNYGYEETGKYFEKYISNSYFPYYVVFYNTKGGTIIGIEETASNFSKLYLTKYGFEQKYNSNVNSNTSEQDFNLISEISSINKISTFYYNYIYDEDYFNFEKKTNNENGYTELYSLSNSTTNKKIVLAFNNDNSLKKIIYIGTLDERYNLENKLKSRGLKHYKKGEKSYFYKDALYYSLEHISQHLVVHIVNNIDNM